MAGSYWGQVRLQNMPHALLESLPPAASCDHFVQVLQLLGRSHVKAVVLDDDPTGTQTVYGLDVLADWGVEALAAALAAPGPVFYILTNSRSMSGPRAASVNREIVANLRKAAELVGTEFVLVSRSDSTLRGHFAVEVGALRQALGTPVDGVIVIPAFFEGGRYTVDDVHYVAEGELLVPAAQTEFARDTTFGYVKSNLREWIEEKTGGEVRSGDVASLGIEALRARDAEQRVLGRLKSLPKGGYLVVNAASYADVDAFVHGLLLAEAEGRRYILRTAASFVRVRAGLVARPVLSAGDYSESVPGGGLVVAGSYTKKTTSQIESLLVLPNTAAIEVQVDRLAAEPSRAAEVARASRLARDAMKSGLHAVVFTSRRLETALGRAGDLSAGEIVSGALVSIVRSVETQPRFMIAKGGITSSDIATRGLGMRRARVLGQAAPGVPVWLMGQETRFPGMKYVVWPGNVGSPDALRDVVRAV